MKAFLDHLERDGQLLRTQESLARIDRDCLERAGELHLVLRRPGEKRHQRQLEFLLDDREKDRGVAPGVLLLPATMLSLSNSGEPIAW